MTETGSSINPKRPPTPIYITVPVIAPLSALACSADVNDLLGVSDSAGVHLISQTVDESVRC